MQVKWQLGMNFLAWTYPAFAQKATSLQNVLSQHPKPSPEILSPLKVCHPSEGQADTSHPEMFFEILNAWLKWPLFLKAFPAYPSRNRILFPHYAMASSFTFHI